MGRYKTGDYLDTPESYCVDVVAYVIVYSATCYAVSDFDAGTDRRGIPYGSRSLRSAHEYDWSRSLIWFTSNRRAFKNQPPRLVFIDHNPDIRIGHLARVCDNVVCGSSIYHGCYRNR